MFLLCRVLQDVETLILNVHLDRKKKALFLFSLVAFCVRVNCDIMVNFCSKFSLHIYGLST